ncbi:acylphosphatase [Aquimarina sp. 2201CG14-23]|uniref:acylphosphatase n=1 Tax=Aquimarina mycalae TaxID=3040073 RepID=UPI002477FA65|nr:acylphosphatase [Aquimarina sp. 2201CG14-23]MDH7445144.1 acylphosphatase [Aquimarina sp. 2201CG14-23]
MLKHYNITVKGKVQGVWYRKSTWEKALELEIKGSVKNQSDGSVYIEAEADEHKLNQFLEWCAKGPEFAEVSQVSHEESDIRLFNFFEILY